MLLHIITPTPAYIFHMMQIYNDFIIRTVDIPFGIDALAETRQNICHPELLHSHFYFATQFLNITPTNLQILMLYSYKVLYNGRL